MVINKEDFISEGNSKYLLQALFYEYGNNQYTKYTLKRRDYKGYPSLYRLYMEMGDPTEYTFATKYLYDWKHWNLLCDTSWFKPHIDEWREELEIKHQAQALHNLKLMSQDKADKNYYQANKFLIDKGWKQKKEKITQTAKDKIHRKAVELAEESVLEKEDYERIVN